MGILLSEVHKELLNELKWVERVEDHINNFRFPMTPKIIEALYGKIKLTTFHSSDIFNIDNIKNMIGTKKTISSFRYMDEYTVADLYGIQTKGGIIYEIEGILNLYSIEDIMSRPDINGIRWIDYHELLPPYLPGTGEYSNTVWISRIRDLKNEYFETENTYLKYENSQAKTKFIKMYFKESEDFIKENKDGIIKKLIGYQIPKGTWDEILISNIQVKDILWTDRIASDTYDRLKRRTPEWQLSNREKYILNNYEIWVDKIHSKLKSITNGKIYGPNINENDIKNFITQRGGHISKKDYEIPSNLPKF